MTPASGGGGIFRFARVSSTGSVPPLVSNASGRFLAICLEFSETLIGTAGVGGANDPSTYSFDNLGAAPINGSAAPTMSGAGLTGTRADDLRRLLGHALPDFAGAVQNTTVGGITASQAALALQLAVWEIANENFGAGAGQFAYNLGTGYLQVTTANANALSQASAWLSTLNAGWTPLNNVYALINERVPGQDFVVQVVPIPAAAWLLGSGLLGLFGLARRKKVAAAA